MRKWLNGAVVCVGLATLTCFCGCKHVPRQQVVFEYGESCVMAGYNPANLAFQPIPGRPVVVRNRYLHDAPDAVVYEEGRDYRLDARRGQLVRTPGSRIPDFSTNVLFGVEDFRHEQFPGFGNGPFFVYVDYGHRPGKLPPVDLSQGSKLLPRTQQRLRAGSRVRIVAFGDSIMAGGDASQPEMVFWARWAQTLRWKYPRARIEDINGATGGDSTVQGLERLQEKVLFRAPDLVLVGFGMNDHNREGYGVPVEAFRANLARMVDRIRASTRAEVVLFSAFPPNPRWHYGSHNMAAYAAATAEIAVEKKCAFADVYGLWAAYTNRKKPEDVLGNNINHPNDYGHWIYLQALQRIGL